jgi:hypothetical protein
MYNKLNNTIKKLNDLGVTVWLVQDVPEHHISALDTWVRATMNEVDLQTVGVESSTYKKFDKIYKDMVDKIRANNLNVKILNINPEICNDTNCLTGDKISPYYYDADHLSVHGSIFFQDTFKPLLEKIKNESLKK